MREQRRLRRQRRGRRKGPLIWRVLETCIEHGCMTEGTLPGVKVERRAATPYCQLSAHAEQSLADALNIID